MLYDTAAIRDGKKFLNLTGTLPKGLLSPTNNQKHKHAGYFESASTIANGIAQSNNNNNNNQSYEKVIPSQIASKNGNQRNVGQQMSSSTQNNNTNSKQNFNIEIYIKFFYQKIILIRHVNNSFNFLKMYHQILKCRASAKT